ncbi:hypothetical protein RCL1_000186 [Eukaryota sp. TZLM3-RCL]
MSSDWLHDALESDASFRAQFQRGSSEYHGSKDTRVVNVNNISAPSGVTEIDPTYETPDYDSFPPAYHKIAGKRQQLETFKKNTDLIVKHIQSLMKYRRMSKTCSDESKLAKINEFILRDTALVNEACSLLASQAQGLDEWTRHAEAIATKAREDATWTKEEVAEFMLSTRQLCQQVFLEQKRMLEQMKAIAKNS